MYFLKPVITILLFALFVPWVSGQVLKGNITTRDEKNKETPLPLANVYWAETTIGTTADINGYFQIELPAVLPARLVTSFVGYKNDTTLIENANTVKIVLKSSVKLKEVTVSEEKRSTNVSIIQPINVETISSKELLKAACCNLSESFETNASVDVVYADAVSGAKKIQMLGLDGTYTQILAENIPHIRGLSSSYGLGFVPGTWIESIQVTKGSGSVVNGYESMAGQINLEFIKPQEAEKLFVNIYGSTGGRAEANIHVRKKLNEQWSTLLFVHGNSILRRNDNNNDGFMDIPLAKQVNVFNRWNFHSGKRLEGQFGIKGLYEDKTGGQTNFKEGASDLFGIGLKNRQAELFTKTGLVFPEKPYKSIGFITSTRFHSLDSYFGKKKYNGLEKTFYANLIYQTIIVHTRHTIRTGSSFLLDYYDESYNDSLFNRKENVPGVFGEYSFNNSGNFSAVAGIRGDYHNLYGLKFNPRVHLKYNLKEETVIRLTAGRGFRVANIFAENASALASSRRVVVEGNFKPEIAWNYGVIFTHNFRIANREVSFNTEFFRTDFSNQVVADYDRTAREIHFYNLNGQSFANSFQSEIEIKPFERFTFRAAYKYYDVKTTYSGLLNRKPLVVNHRALFNTAYATNFEKWKFDFTTQLFGKSRIPTTMDNPVELQLQTQSSPYFIMNAQITKVFRLFEAYLGVENLNNFMQINPIIAPQDPFGTHFDASLIWGPTMGRVIYGGIRFSIK